MGRVVSYNDGLNRCEFCGKDEHQVRRLVKGPSCAICDECIRLCAQIIQEDMFRSVDSANPTSFDDFVAGDSAAFCGCAAACSTSAILFLFISDALTVGIRQLMDL